NESLCNAMSKSIERGRNQADKNGEARSAAGEANFVPSPEPILVPPWNPHECRVPRERLCQSEVGKAPQVCEIAVADEIRSRTNRRRFVARMREIHRVDCAAADRERDQCECNRGRNFAPSDVLSHRTRDHERRESE